jgi:hypothetical protein
MAKEDDQAIRDATEAAIASVRSLINNGINPRAMVGTLSETEIGLIVTSAVFAWIKAKAEAYMRYGIASVEQAIRTMNRDPEPHEAGAAASIMSKLAETDVPWDKPVTDWTKDEMIRLAWAAHKLVDAAMAEINENMPNVVRRSLDETEREYNSAHGGPLMTQDEMGEAF